MDSGQALAELIDISPQVELALVFDSEGRPVASTLGSDSDAESLALSALSLVTGASRAAGEEHGEPAQVELAYPEGSILLTREGDLRILALTSPEPIAALVFFDLRTCLGKISGTTAKKRRLNLRRPGRKAEPPKEESEGGGGDDGTA
jgi:predicted regulator of Ras-like GTPase activity (Roadblock/LC7/MglB family)